jgi:chromosome segregation ATPase
MNPKRQLLLTATFATACTVVTEVTNAANLYRYRNHQGVVEVSTRIPTEYVKNGYEVVSQDGKVLKVVDPQLSKIEYEAKLARQEVQRSREEAVRRLIALYGSEDDIRHAEASKIKSIENAIAQAKSDVARLRNEKARLEEQAAMRERTGAATNGDTIKYLKVLERRIADRVSEIEKRHSDIEEARRQFHADRELFREVHQYEYGASS